MSVAFLCVHSSLQVLVDGLGFGDAAAALEGALDGSYSWSLQTTAGGSRCIFLSLCVLMRSQLVPGLWGAMPDRWLCDCWEGLLTQSSLRLLLPKRM